MTATRPAELNPTADRTEIGPPPFEFQWSMSSSSWMVKRSRWWGRASHHEITQIISWVNDTHGVNLETPNPPAGAEPVCPTCEQPHSGTGLQYPDGWSGCPTCGACA